jgi:hypothetical protein
MPNIYDEEVIEADKKYQKEPTLINELSLEKAKLKFWLERCTKNPNDREALGNLKYHQSEVDRLEAEQKMG